MDNAAPFWVSVSEKKKDHTILTPEKHLKL